MNAIRAIPHVTASAVVRRVIGDLDRDALAASAIVEADGRAAGSGGRFSRYDVRAGAIRAVARSRVVAEAGLLREVVDDVEARALRLAVDVLDESPGVPAHVKALVSRATVQAKRDLADRSSALGAAREDPAPISITALGTGADPATQLAPAQMEAACAVAGGSRLVTVIGPAGSGKTSLLRAARRALSAQRRRMLVVAPTRKAALVAGVEIGVPACSVHALLHDHGYRFITRPTGQQIWERIRAGDAEATTGAIYRGPRIHLGPGDRIVVDEAGMLDLNAANALARLALATGAGLALVGDPLQAAPVGHSGAMAIMRRHSASVVELNALHRFADRGYGNLTLKLRDPADRSSALKIAAELHATGRVHAAASEADAREHMVEVWLHHTGQGHRIALVVGSNTEAHRLNERIQQERIDSGELDDQVMAYGQDQQRLLIGDLLQTRRNARSLGIANRDTWVITGIEDRGIRLISATDSGRVRMISHGYAHEHAHLAYASTVHGVQGETVDVSLVGPDVDAAGLYVGMTRGRMANTAMVVAHNAADAIQQLADTMARGRPELTFRDSRNAAAADLRHAARDPGYAFGSRAPVHVLVAAEGSVLLR